MKKRMTMKADGTTCALSRRSCHRWIYALGALWWLAGTRPCLAQEPDVRLLFVGNSYTYGNDLDQLVKALLEAGVPNWKQAHAIREAPGGYRWEQHAKDADGTNGDTSLRRHLVMDPNPLFKWDFVVFQEQSQIPGFAQSNTYWRASLAGLKILDGLSKAKGAVSVVMMTWGRRKGDSMNQGRFPDFPTMQLRLAEGYRAYAAQASTAQAPVLLAPVGLAFAYIYDDIRAAGKDPLDPQSAFSLLYESDDSHPSLRGSYLAACVLYATIAKRDPRQLSWAPAALSSAEATLYRAAAWAVTMPATSNEVTTEIIPEPPADGASEAMSEKASPEHNDETGADKAPDTATPAPELDPEHQADTTLPSETDTSDGTSAEQSGSFEAALEGNPPPEAPLSGQGCCQVNHRTPSIWLWLLVAFCCCFTRRGRAAA